MTLNKTVYLTKLSPKPHPKTTQCLSPKKNNMAQELGQFTSFADYIKYIH